MLNSIISIVSLASIAIVAFLRYQDKIKLGFSVDRWVFSELGSGLLIAFVPISIAFGIIWMSEYAEIQTVALQVDSFFKSLVFLSFAAFIEELLFRTGLLLCLIYFTKRIWLSIGIEIVLFGIAHMLNPTAD